MPPGGRVCALCWNAGRMMLKRHFQITVKGLIQARHYVPKYLGFCYCLTETGLKNQWCTTTKSSRWTENTMIFKVSLLWPAAAPRVFCSDLGLWALVCRVLERTKLHHSLLRFAAAIRLLSSRGWFWTIKWNNRWRFSFVIFFRP
jgi:hypothetical protein